MRLIQVCSRSMAVLHFITAGSTLAAAWSVREGIESRCNTNVPNRRGFFHAVGTGAVAASFGALLPLGVATIASAGVVDPKGWITDLQESKQKMEPIPDLLEAKEWNKVRSILKLPPVNKLWNLGDSQNTVLQMAKATGDIDLFELKDELAYNLQMCDQLTYDNAFVYYQPGNGKFKIKEPQELARKAIRQIQEVIDIVSAN